MADTLSKINQIKILSQNVTNNKLVNNFEGSKNKELRDVAEQFEAIFIHQMLKQARQSKLAEGIFNSEAQDTLTICLIWNIQKFYLKRIILVFLRHS